MWYKYHNCKENSKKSMAFYTHLYPQLCGYMIHRGEIVEKAVRNSGMNITKLAAMINVNRKTIYNFFEHPELALDVIVKIGVAIKYDFRKDFPELFIPDTSMIVAEPIEGYSSNLSECLKEKNEWKSKYYEVLEENNKLLKQLNNIKNS